MHIIIVLFKTYFQRWSIITLIAWILSPSMPLLHVNCKTCFIRCFIVTFTTHQYLTFMDIFHMPVKTTCTFKFSNTLPTIIRNFFHVHIAYTFSKYYLQIVYYTYHNIWYLFMNVLHMILQIWAIFCREFTLMAFMTNFVMNCFFMNCLLRLLESV